MIDYLVDLFWTLTFWSLIGLLIVTLWYFWKR